MIDELDRAILEHLTEDGRRSFRSIADEVDTSAVTVTNRVDKMAEKGVIQDYSVNINHEKLGYELAAHMSLETKGDRTELRERLDDTEHIHSMYRVTGDTDMVLIGKFQDQNQLSSFVKERLLSDNSDLVERVNTQIIMDTYREGHPGPLG